eukprot:3563811-Rhodomonas_salina.2
MTTVTRVASPPLVLHRRYVMSATEISNANTRQCILRSLATSTQIWTQAAIALRASYAISVSDLRLAATRRGAFRAPDPGE